MSYWRTWVYVAVVVMLLAMVSASLIHLAVAVVILAVGAVLLVTVGKHHRHGSTDE